MSKGDMRCRRCQGLMVWDRFIDFGQTDLLWAFACRCVNCGEVLDAVILAHRRTAPLRKAPSNAKGGRRLMDDARRLPTKTT